MTIALPAQLSAILLAGGASRRFGGENKLLVSIDGEPVLRRVARVLIASGIGEVIAVTGFDPAGCAAALSGLPVRLVHNPDWADGMGGTISAGVRAVSADMAGVLIVPGDMPRLSDPVVKELLAHFALYEGERIIAPVTGAGEQVNPVLWPRRFISALADLPREEGAKRLLSRLSDARVDVRISDEAALADMDTPQEYERLVNGACS